MISDTLIRFILGEPEHFPTRQTLVFIEALHATKTAIFTLKISFEIFAFFFIVENCAGLTTVDITITVFTVFYRASVTLAFYYPETVFAPFADI